MKLENITAELRPRSNWEAADLGGALARRDYGAILLRQALLILPIWGLLAFAFFNHPGWALLFIWWLKPIYERVPLFYLSRSLFGEKPTLRETLGAAPRLLFKDIVMGLVVIRLSPSRSVFQPVNQLEGLRGGFYFKRARALGNRASGGGVTPVMALLEVGLALSLVALVALLIPFSSPIDWKSLGLSLLRFEAGTIPTDMFWMLNGIYATAVFLLTPFYAGAGFGIYINARSVLEGWDIELTLRRLGERLSSVGNSKVGAVSLSGGKAAVIAFLGVFAFGCIADKGVAAPRAEDAIEEVLADPDFEIQKEMRQFRVVEDLGRGENGGSKIAGSRGSSFGMLLFYGLAGLGAAALLWLIWRWSQGYVRGVDSGKGGRKALTVMGMEIDAESLPDNIPAAAAAAWEAGDFHRAVSLLYRGALSWLVEYGHVRIEESDTEHECLSRAGESMGDTGRGKFFAEVTDHWILQAYGNIPPNEEVFRSVCAGWPFGHDRSAKIQPNKTA